MAEPVQRSTPDVRTSAGRLPGLPDVVLGHASALGDGWATGCTVVLPPPGTVGGVAVGGGAPGTRETDALAPGTLVSTVDAVLLTGGSAYGLAAADGVMAWCEQAGRGYVVSPPGSPVVRVPIVPAAVVFDLGRGGDPGARPTAAFGWAACEAAGALVRGADGGPGDLEGAVGAGTGARVSAGTASGGVGVAGGRVMAASAPGADAPAGDSWALAAVVVANAAGVPVGTAAPGPPPGAPAGTGGRQPGPPGLPAPLNTTLAVVVTDAALDTAAATRLAAAAHAGLARAVEPSHTLVDGDVVFALATGAAPAPTDLRDRVGLEAAAARAVTEAFARAVAGGTMAG